MHSLIESWKQVIVRIDLTTVIVVSALIYGKAGRINWAVHLADNYAGHVT
jgi:hypothetical protein